MNTTILIARLQSWIDHGQGQNAGNYSNSLARRVCMAILCTALCVAVPHSSRAELSAEAKQIIGKTATDYLASNPKEVIRIITEIQRIDAEQTKREQEQKLAQHKSKIFDATASVGVLGNPEGTQSLVIFSDPMCGFCRKFNEVLEQAIAENPNLKVLVRDIAIMHPKSDLVARALITAQLMGQYREAQKLFYEVEVEVDEDKIVEIAKKMGLDPKEFVEKLNSDEVRAALESNLELSRLIDLEGTPTLVRPDPLALHAGVMSYKDFKKFVAGAEMNETEADSNAVAVVEAEKPEKAKSEDRNTAATETEGYRGEKKSPEVAPSALEEQHKSKAKKHVTIETN